MTAMYHVRTKEIFYSAECSQTKRSSVSTVSVLVKMQFERVCRECKHIYCTRDSSCVNESGSAYVYLQNNWHFNCYSAVLIRAYTECTQHSYIKCLVYISSVVCILCMLWWGLQNSSRNISFFVIKHSVGIKNTGSSTEHVFSYHEW